MANVNAANGFVPLGHLVGSAPNFGLDRFYIQSTNTHAIFRGDPVILSSGYIDTTTAGTEAILGIFWGCHYNSVARKMPVWSMYWPGSDAITGNLDAFIITDPGAQFVAQSDGTSAIAQSAVGQMGQFVVGTGSTTTGQSGYMLNHTTGTTTTYPFRVLGLLSDWAAPGVNGTDNTSAYNRVVVGFNNQLSRVTAAP